MSHEPTPPPAPPEGWLGSLLHSAKGLTLNNVLIIALLMLVAVPVYFVYTVLNEPATLDRFLSSYSEVQDKDSECTVRKARVRGGPWLWSVSAGFAAQRSDRYNLSVVLPEEPDINEIASYCATINLIIEQMLFGYHGDPAP